MTAPRGPVARLPLGPLERLVKPRNDDELALALGASRRSVTRWRQRGIDWWIADVLATAIGLHPSWVWPQWWDLDEQEAVSA